MDERTIRDGQRVGVGCLLYVVHTYVLFPLPYLMFWPQRRERLVYDDEASLESSTTYPNCKRSGKTLGH
jgi:hypothetical protein